MAADDFAVLVGVSSYPALGDLEGPEHDVNDFEKWLIHDAEVPATNITRICTKKFPPPPADDPSETRPFLDDLKRPFVKYLKDARKKGDRIGRRLYLYFSGHGFATGLDAIGLFPANVEKNLTFEAMPGLRYAQWMAIRPFFSEFVVFMDCCRDFVPVDGALGDPIWKFDAYADPGKHANVAWGIAAEFNKKAIEKKFDTEGVRGIFTRALIRALREAPGNPAGQVTIDDIRIYVDTLLKDDADNPSPIFNQINPSKPIILLNRKKQEAALIRVALNVAGMADGVVDLSDPPDPPFQEVPIKQGKGAAELKAGLYKATVRGTGRFENFEVSGETVDVQIA
jgi:hypothetical protein